jgi:hypothetical protein
MRTLGFMAFTTLALLASGPALASGLDFKLGNATGYDIQAVQVGPAGSDQWVEVNMGDDSLADGSTVEISFTGDPDSCKWDLKVDWSEDYPSTVWQDVNLCNISDITLHYNRDTDETTAELK